MLANYLLWIRIELAHGSVCCYIVDQIFLLTLNLRDAMMKHSWSSERLVIAEGEAWALLARGVVLTELIGKKSTLVDVSTISGCDSLSAFRNTTVHVHRIIILWLVAFLCDFGKGWQRWVFHSSLFLMDLFDKGFVHGQQSSAAKMDKFISSLWMGLKCYGLLLLVFVACLVWSCMDGDFNPAPDEVSMIYHSISHYCTIIQRTTKFDLTDDF